MAKETKVYKCRGIVRGESAGAAAGEAVVSTDAMCFFLCDPQTGVVIERNHALRGKSIAGKVLVLKSGKGSSVVQVDGFYQLWVKGTLPAAIILKDTEPVIVSAAVVVGEPMVDRLEADPYSVIRDGDWVEVDVAAGEIRVTEGGW
jgi:predicted aconitase with swiveling domain